MSWISKWYEHSTAGGMRTEESLSFELLIMGLQWHSNSNFVDHYSQKTHWLNKLSSYQPADVWCYVWKFVSNVRIRKKKRYFFLFLFIINHTINLINKFHYKCEKKKYIILCNSKAHKIISTHFCNVFTVMKVRRFLTSRNEIK